MRLTKCHSNPKQLRNDRSSVQNSWRPVQVLLANQTCGERPAAPHRKKAELLPLIAAQKGRQIAAAIAGMVGIRIVIGGCEERNEGGIRVPLQVSDSVSLIAKHKC